MFGLNEAQYNIVKQAARKCAADLKGEIEKGGKYDQIAAGIITKHHSPVSVLVTRLRFIWLIGYLQGRFGQTGEYE